MDSVLFWIDRITDPYFVFMAGMIGGVICALMTGGLFGLFGASTRSIRWAILATFVMSSISIWTIFIALWVWYNTPMGPPLELVIPPKV